MIQHGTALAQSAIACQTDESVKCNKNKNKNNHGSTACPTDLLQHLPAQCDGGAGKEQGRGREAGRQEARRQAERDLGQVAAVALGASAVVTWAGGRVGSSGGRGTGR